MYVLMLVCMYEFYLDLLSVNTFIIEKCDVLKEMGKKDINQYLVPHCILKYRKSQILV